jgi:hypothetical protein
MAAALDANWQMARRFTRMSAFRVPRRHLARVLELDVPMFVGKALEVSERAEGARS